MAGRYSSRHPGCDVHVVALSVEHAWATPPHACFQLQPSCPPHPPLLLNALHGHALPSHAPEPDG